MSGLVYSTVVWSLEGNTNLKLHIPFFKPVSHYCNNINSWLPFKYYLQIYLHFWIEEGEEEGYVLIFFQELSV